MPSTRSVPVELVMLATDSDPDLRLASMAGFHRSLGGGSGLSAGPRLSVSQARAETVWLGEPDTSDTGEVELFVAWMISSFERATSL